jgi:hypothetical protein
MADGGTAVQFERGAASNLWRNTLSRIPTTFGRLVYLNSLRNVNTGAYEHFGLAQAFGENEADLTLRRSHSQTFADWLRFGLEAQKADLDMYISELDGDRREILKNWIQLKPYRNLAPAKARPVEIELYSNDFETLLEVLKHQYGVSSPDRDA